MISTATLKPLQRQALRAAFASPDYALKRCRGGYAAPGGAVFTVRTINGMQADGLLLFVPPQFPSSVTLTGGGRALAQQLTASDRAQAGAA